MSKIKPILKPKTIRVLELFKGTGSVEKAVNKLYPNRVEVISVDIEPKFNPTYCCDFMDFDYMAWQPGHFDIVWASPPCTFYSRMQRFSPKSKEYKQSKLEKSNELVQRVLQCIEYLRPRRWYIENPQTGTLKNQEFMQELDYCDATYCMYGYPYRKQTRFWTNRPKQLKLCSASRRKDRPHCDNYDHETGRHPEAISLTSKKFGTKYSRDNTNKEQRYRIPQELLCELIS